MKKIIASLIITLTFTVLPAAIESAAAHQGQMTFAPVLREVTPAVVNISVTATKKITRNPLMDDPFFRRFFNLPEQQGPQTRQHQSVGSGVIINADKGYVVTNHHVVDGADEIRVTLQDRRQFKAELLGSDEATDIALLEIDADDLSEVPVGDSESIEVGDFVVAIGNPFGLGQTVTSGIVSALGRSGVIAQGYEDFIQTDASINPGNSGGALVSLEGQLIGINTAIITPAGGNVGIGFAVPVNMMQGVVAQLIEHGEVERGQLGVVIQDVTPDLAEALELDSPEGALVSEVMAGSAAEDADIRVGDVVTAVNDKAIRNSAQLRNTIGLMRVGEELELSIVRDGRSLEVEAEIGEPSKVTRRGGQNTYDFAGATLRDATPRQEGYGAVEGVEVIEVEPGTKAWRAGLRQNDIILSVNRRATPNLEAFTEVIDDTNGTTALHVQRGNSKLFIVMP